MPSYRRPLAPKKEVPPVIEGPLRSLQLIETVGSGPPYRIVPIIRPEGTVISPADLMAARVQWAERASYTVITREVPAQFAPYNAVIRISQFGTEDRQRDYLAHLVHA